MDDKKSRLYNVVTILERTKEKIEVLKVALPTEIGMKVLADLQRDLGEVVKVIDDFDVKLDKSLVKLTRATSKSDEEVILDEVRKEISEIRVIKNLRDVPVPR